MFDCLTFPDEELRTLMTIRAMWKDRQPEVGAANTFLIRYRYECYFFKVANPLPLRPLRPLLRTAIHYIKCY